MVVKVAVLTVVAVTVVVLKYSFVEILVDVVLILKVASCSGNGCDQVVMVNVKVMWR